MSLLYRTGSGRNNIAWGGGTTAAATYLRRISNGRNDINYISISTSGTYNILNRTSTGRNNISWINTTFSFLSFTGSSTKLYNYDDSYMTYYGASGSSVVDRSYYIYEVESFNYLTNGYDITRGFGRGYDSPIYDYFLLRLNAETENIANNLVELISRYSTITLLLNNSTVVSNTMTRILSGKITDRNNNNILYYCCSIHCKNINITEVNNSINTITFS